MFQSSGNKKHDDAGSGGGKEKESHKEKKRRMQLSALKSDIDSREKQLKDVRQQIADAKKMIYDLNIAINDATESVNAAKQALLLALVKTNSEDAHLAEISSDVNASEGSSVPAGKDIRLTTLPRPILKHILTYVGIRELGRLSQCCRYLSSICADDTIWESRGMDPTTEILYYSSDRRMKQKTSGKGMPRSTSDYFSPDMADEQMPDPFDKVSPKNSIMMLNISGDSSSSSSPSSAFEQNLRAVLSPRVGRKRGERKFQSLLFVNPPLLDSSASLQQPQQTRTRTSSTTASVPGSSPLSPFPSSDSATPRSTAVQTISVHSPEDQADQPLCNSVGEPYHIPTFRSSGSSTLCGDSAPISLKSSQTELGLVGGESSSYPNDFVSSNFSGRTALDKLFGNGSGRRNLLVSVAPTPMRRRTGNTSSGLSSNSNSIGSPSLTTIGQSTLSAKDRCKYAPCAYPPERIARTPNAVVVPQAKRVKINVVYSRVPSLFFRPQQQPSLMDIVYDYNPDDPDAKAPSSQSAGTPMTPAMLAERESVQSRLIRYTIFGDYDEKDPHPAVVQLNEMGRDAERCHTFLQVFFRNTNGVLLVYDASVDCAFSRLSSVDMDVVHRYCASRNPQIFLLGYLTSGFECEVDLSEIHKYCIANNLCDLGVVSIKKPSEVVNAFSCMAFRVLRPLFS